MQGVTIHFSTKTFKKWMVHYELWLNWYIINNRITWLKLKKLKINALTLTYFLTTANPSSPFLLLKFLKKKTYFETSKDHITKRENWKNPLFSFFFYIFFQEGEDAIGKIYTTILHNMSIQGFSRFNHFFSFILG